jgi:hypothetical protein
MSTDNQREKGIVSRCMNSRRRFDCCIRGGVVENKPKRVHCYLRYNTIDHDIFAIISSIISNQQVWRVKSLQVQRPRNNPK